jgi:putative transcriptional regulator
MTLEPKFESSLSMEEIEENFKNVDFFSGLMDGLQEALAYSQGSAKAETFARKRSLPDVNVAQLRKSLSMTQRSFADILGVSCRTVEAWESGKTTPTPTARKLMGLIQDDHGLVQKLQGSAL